MVIIQKKIGLILGIYKNDYIEISWPIEIFIGQSL
jgi:hypothetical protein